MLQARFNSIWISVVSFLSLSTPLFVFLGVERIPAFGNHNGRAFSISQKQIASAWSKGDLYLLGVGKADITGFVEEIGVFTFN
jgi:hypothetical protein